MCIIIKPLNNNDKFYGMFTVHFPKIENNDIQQMLFNTNM
jgi:hypothetical protein